MSRTYELRGRIAAVGFTRFPPLIAVRPLLRDRSGRLDRVSAEFAQ